MLRRMRAGPALEVARRAGGKVSTLSGCPRPSSGSEPGSDDAEVGQQLERSRQVVELVEIQLREGELVDRRHPLDGLDPCRQRDLVGLLGEVGLRVLGEEDRKSVV